MRHPVGRIVSAFYHSFSNRNAEHVRASGELARQFKSAKGLTLEECVSSVRARHRPFEPIAGLVGSNNRIATNGGVWFGARLSSNRAPTCIYLHIVLVRDAAAHSRRT